MKNTSRYVVCAMLLAGGLAMGSSNVGCGSDEEDGGGKVDFYGDYKPSAGHEGGEIGTLWFGGDHDYRLRPKSCSEVACEESGKFAYDANARHLKLTDTKTGNTRSFPVKVLKTSKNASSSSNAGLVKPQAGGQQLINNGGKDIVKEGQQTTENGKQLIDMAKQLLEIISQAQVGNQEMEQEKEENKAEQEQQQAEVDKAKAEADKAKAEAEKAQAEADKAKAEAEAAKNAAGDAGGGGGGGGGADNGGGAAKGGAAGG